MKVIIREPKLLASLPSNLQIMSVLILCKAIWVTKFKTSIVLRFCALLWREHYEENFTFTRLNNLENDSKKNQKNRNF